MAVWNNDIEVFWFYGEEEEERYTKESRCALCNVSILKQIVPICVFLCVLIHHRQHSS